MPQAIWDFLNTEIKNYQQIHLYQIEPEKQPFQACENSGSNLYNRQIGILWILE